MTHARVTSMSLEWGWAGAAIAGATGYDDSGDRHIVATFDGGALLGVIDGLGHGRDAALAAKQAVRLLEQEPHQPPDVLIERCHDALRRTRGAAITLASFSSHESVLTWLAVGNVDALVIRGHMGTTPEREAITPGGGVVGYKLPPALRPKTMPMFAGDLLVMATDGIASGFTSCIKRTQAPQRMADAILAQYRNESDDALVLVAKFGDDAAEP